MKTCCLCCVKMASSSKYPDAVAELANAQNLFTSDLYQSLISSSNGNIFFSPFSIMTAVAMTHMGAKANTEKQIQTAFHFPNDKQQIQKALKSILPVLKSDEENYQLYIANSAYVSDKLTILDSYADSLVNDFYSKMQSVDYNKPEVVRRQINDFVDEETRSKISELIPPGILCPLTRMVLVNAVYFKGLWKHQFDPKRTKDLPFWLSAENSLKTPMMSAKKKFKYGIKPEIGAKILSMDYKGNEMSMVVVLPDEREGLAELEKKLATTDFAGLDNEFNGIEIIVLMPKFKLENSFELPETLKRMGVTDLFSRDLCDLSGISGGKELFVSNVFHKSFIEVNEEGSEAAAATGIATDLRSGYLEPITFIADHPFFFFLKHNPSGQILFAGRLMNPESSDVCEKDTCPRMEQSLV